MVISMDISKPDGIIWQATEKDDDFFDDMGLDGDKEADDWANYDEKNNDQNLPGIAFNSRNQKGS